MKVKREQGLSKDTHAKYQQLFFEHYHRGTQISHIPIPIMRLGALGPIPIIFIRWLFVVGPTVGAFIGAMLGCLVGLFVGLFVGGAARQQRSSAFC
jgi:hypothetical protein